MPPSATPPGGGVLPAGGTTQTYLGVSDPNYQPPPRSFAYGEPDIPGQRPYSQSVMGMGTPEVRYKPGDELIPLNTPELVPQLQAQLASIGYLDAKKIRLGVWDPTSQAAYRKVLGYANQLGVTAQEAISILAANPTIGDLQGDGSSGSRAPNIVEETNPLDIAATAQQVAQKLLGRNLTEAQLKPLIAQVQGSEQAAQQKQYKLGGANGGVVVTPPSVDAAAEDYYRKNFGPELMGYAAVERYNEFLSLLNSPVAGT